MQRAWGSCLIMAVCVICFGALVGIPQTWWQEQFTFGQGEPVPFVVPPQASPEQIADIIVRQGITGNATELTEFLRAMGVAASLHSGIYAVRPGTPQEVVLQLQGQHPQANIFALEAGIPLFPDEMALRLSTTSPMLIALLSSADLFPVALQPLLPQDPESRLALLLPGLYTISSDAPLAETVIRQASSAWWLSLGSLLGDADAQEVLGRASLAAIVQQEAPLEADRPALAGLYVNRLVREIPLQSSATIRYAWAREGHPGHPLSWEGLRLVSPFNTFLQPGLPPVPIALPSETAWKAALQPEQHDFLFAASGADRHLVFSKTYGEHVASQGQNP